MSRSIIWGIVRFLVLLCTQVLVLDNINLFGYVEPMLYIWFILLLPIKTPKWLVLILSFLMGFCVDIFAGQVGFHTAVSTFTGFLRPIFFPWQTTLKKTRAICVQKCAADIYTAKRSRSAATRSHLDIISVTLWKPL